MNYNTGISASPPHLIAQMPSSPYSYPGSFGDSYNAMRSGLESKMAMENRDEALGMQNKKLRSQRDVALSGLRDLAQAEQQQTSLREKQAGMQLGLVNGLLSGLFS